MTSGIKALITPSVLKWAREQAGMNITIAAEQIGRSENEIDEWEKGVSLPSLAQARKISEKYKRALAVFYLPEPPKTYQTLRDYRSFNSSDGKIFSPQLSFLIQRAEHRQEWLNSTLLEEGKSPLSFIGSASISSLTIEVSKNIKSVFKITTKNQKESKTRDEALNLWIKGAENLGINICREGKIDSKELRGFVISDKLAPFIYLNSNDAKAAQLFTLLHEVAHLWIDASGISNIIIFKNKLPSKDQKVEIFCNEVASLVLLENEEFVKTWNLLPLDVKLNEKIEKCSSVFKVSEEVIARRLTDLGIIKNEQYEELREYYNKRWVDLQKKKKIKRQNQKGGPSVHLLQVLSNGKVFTRAILNSYSADRITGVDASNYLNAKINHFYKLSKYAGL